MRVLFTSTPNYGHLYPLVPFARALADAGHEIAFAMRASFAPALADLGFRHFPAGLDRDINDVLCWLFIRPDVFRAAIVDANQPDQAARMAHG